ncbi:uncharacterized protein [Antedon mediterranea]|uniref:uncharacterized protein n=1 Tax=Antedon mediterranea TaxID=105859 RepID=UPI003AF5654B
MMPDRKSRRHNVTEYVFYIFLLMLLSNEGSVTGISYLGCFKDASSRAMPAAFTENNDMTIEFCIQYCNGLGHLYSGLQYYRQCFCGDETYNNLGQMPESDCNCPCDGNAQQICGGGWRNSVYYSGNQETTTKLITTPEPTTEVETTSEPTTEVETTPEPTTEVETTSEPTTEVETTPEPTTEVETTPELTSEDVCEDILGAVNGSMHISDNGFSASSQHGGDKNGAHKARLNTPLQADGKGGSWRAATVDNMQWVQVDLCYLTNVSGIITQGRNNNNNNIVYVSKYKVLYSTDGINFVTISGMNGAVREFIGNYDRNTEVVNIFDGLIEAQFIRVNPTEWSGTVAMRFAVLGCLVNSSCPGTVNLTCVHISRRCDS